MIRTVLLLWGSILWLSGASPAVAQSAIQAEAEAALVAGNPARTQALAIDMLAQNPGSYAALFILTLAQADLGDDRTAAQTAVAAYDAAPDATSRVQAARLAASTRFALGQYARAEYWLRRAANDVQTQDEAKAVAREYLRTVDANPLSLEITAYVAPSDNINSGSEEGILRLEGIDLEFLLPEDQLALSGIEFAGSARLNYRLSETDVQRTSLTGLLSAKTFRLSKDAKDLLESSPNAEIRQVEGNDFSTLLAEVGITHQRNDLSPLGPVSLGLNFGTYWEGQERLVNYQDLIVQQFIPFNDTNALTLRASVRDQDALQPLLVDSVTYDLIGSYDRLLASRDQLSLSLGWRQSDAGSENSYYEYRAGLGYSLDQPVLGTSLSTSLEVGYRTYDAFITTLDGRDDRFITAQVDAIFEQITYFGFSPSISVSATRTESTAEEITSSAFQVLFGIESNF